MKPKINLRLCVAGNPSLLTQFKKCLDSYLEFYEIDELLIYTTSDIFTEVQVFTEGKANMRSIQDIDKFYKEHKETFSQDVAVVLDYSRDKKFKKHLSMFYLRMRLVMDYYLIGGRKPFILSDIDVIMFPNTEPIREWLKSDYVLYNADFYDNYYHHSKTIMNSVGEDFFKPLPQFNNGWMCVPKDLKININKVFLSLIQDMDSCPGEMSAMAIWLINNKIKTKLLPRNSMITKSLQTEDKADKTLAHLGPYALG